MRAFRFLRRFAYSLALLLGLGGVLSGSGCSGPPERAAWKPDQAAIEPRGGASSTPGRLVVETSLLGFDNGKERRQAFQLYDEQGRYLDRYPNDTLAPITLPQGRYVVVTRVHLAQKRVQVTIQDGRTTQVSLNDFKGAPDAN